jgi:hypothetical protein
LPAMVVVPSTLSPVTRSSRLNWTETDPIS